MRRFSHNELLRLADRQHDIVGLDDLHALGLKDSAIRRRVRAGILHRHFHRVFSPSRYLTDHGRWFGAVLACGRSTALADASAGTLHEMVFGDGAAKPFVVSSRHLDLRGIVIRNSTLYRWEVTKVDGIVVTTPARTLVDLCARASPNRVKTLIDRTEELRLYDHRQVLRVLHAHPRIPGAARLRDGLAGYTEPVPTKNQLEDAMRRICNRINRPHPRVNNLVEGFEVDFFWPYAKVIVETDGRRTHLTRTAFEDDRARDAELTARGYRVVRFTYRQVMNHPDQVARILLRVLADQ